MDAIGKFTNRNNFKISDLTDELKELQKIDKRNIEYIEDPETVLSQNRGFCYDQTFLARQYLNHLNIKNDIFYSCTNNIQKLNGQYIYNNNKVISHVFIIYQLDNKFKWLQWSWFAQIRNTWAFDTLDDILKAYKEMAEKSWHNKIILTNINDLTPKRSRLEFLNLSLNKPFIYGQIN